MRLEVVEQPLISVLRRQKKEYLWVQAQPNLQRVTGQNWLFSESLSQENNNNEYMNTVSLTKKEKLKILKNIR
jgi:hypothetical protein